MEKKKKKSDVGLIEKLLLSYILNKDDMFSLQIRDGARMMAKVFFIVDLTH